VTMPVERHAYNPPSGGTGNLADILERVLDKGIVIAGDIRVNLLDIELLTIKLRLLIASADTAREMGIDWWRNDPFLSGADRDRLPTGQQGRQLDGNDGRADAESSESIGKRLDRIEAVLQALGDNGSGSREERR